MRNWIAATGLAVATTLASTSLGLAQDAYPERQISLVVPYSPGGATDIIGRIVADGLRAELGQAVVVENVAGAAGSLGAGRVAGSTPDGYTLLLGALTSHSISVSLPPPPEFDLLTDFEPIGLAGSVGLALVTRPDLPVSSVEEFLTLARSDAGGLTYASSGSGSPQHLGMEMLKDAADIDVVHVPYPGSGPAITDLIGGHVDVMIDTVPSVLAHVSSGGVKALAVTTPEPSPFLADLPTVASSGIEGFEVQSWFGLLAPAGTPDAVTDRLNEALNTILAKPEVAEALERQGVVPAPGSKDDERALIETQIAQWAAVIEAAGPLE